MRKLFFALILMNLIFFISTLIYNANKDGEIALVEEGVTPLKVLPHSPEKRYSASNAIEGTSSCFTVGPFYSEKAAQLVAGNIRTFGMEVTIRSMKSKETLNYLVYIPSQSSKKVAQDIVKDLWQHSVDDYRIVESGPYKYSITFGFHKNFEQAKRATEYIRYLGYDAKYTEQKIKRKVYWIDYDEPLGTGIPALSWSKAIDPDANVQIIPRTCDQRAWYGNNAFASAAGVPSQIDIEKMLK